METAKTASDGVLTMALQGRLDTNTAPPFQEEASRELAGAKALVLDLTDLEYISSAGVRAILFLQKQCGAQGASMTLRGCNEVVMDVLRITGLDQVLQFED